MKAELEQQDIEAIAQRVTELMSVNSKSGNDDVIFDKKGLSGYLNISESTINKLVSDKHIPHFKIQPGQSGGVRFSKRDIDRWISKHTIPEINQFTVKLR